MVIRPYKGIVEPNPKYALPVEQLPITEPTRLNAALNNPLWLEAMHEELRALARLALYFLEHQN